MTRPTPVLLGLAAVIGIGASAFIKVHHGAQHAAQHHVLQNAGDATWGPAPPMLPAGAEIAVVSGDPTKTGAYVVRLKFPADYAIPAHSHPTDENVAVVSGALFVGMGDKLDRAAGRPLTSGGFAELPAKMNHFAFTKAATTILLFGQGPVEFNYVDPNDDPRRK